MKKRVLFLFIALWLAGGAFLFGHQEGVHKGILVDKEIHISSSETQENVIILGGSALIEGTIEENVVALGGRVTLSGTVNDDLVSLGSRIELKSTAVVKGDVVCIGGELTKEPGCRIEGDTNYFKLSSLFPKFADGWKGFFTMSLIPFILVFKLVMVFIWLVITLVVASAIPQRITFASAQIRRSFAAVLGTGALGLLAYILLVILAALLCIFLIGIPILLALLAAHFFITVFGQVAVYHYFGDSLSHAFGRQKTSPLGASLLRLLVVSFVTFIPILGLLASLVLDILVFGVTLRTKFGSTENWFQRKAA